MVPTFQRLSDFNGNCSCPETGLYGRSRGRRFAVYVPDDMAPDVRQARENAHALQALLAEAGRRYTEARKRERRARR